MAILHVLEPHLKDLDGGFMVRRVLPAALRQTTGLGVLRGQPGADQFPTSAAATILR